MASVDEKAPLVGGPAIPSAPPMEAPPAYEELPTQGLIVNFRINFTIRVCMCMCVCDNMPLCDTLWVMQPYVYVTVAYETHAAQ